jgi:hypothetical protein
MTLAGVREATSLPTYLPMKTAFNPLCSKSTRWLWSVLAAVSLVIPRHALAVGSWRPLANYPTEGIGHMLLLSDGTVMAQGGGGIGVNWFRLTPDFHGSYVNGTWSTLKPMNDTREYYSSEVLPDGRVFVAGGEYGSGYDKAEVYDPVANAWTPIPVPAGLITTGTNVSSTPGSVGAHQAGFIDSLSVVLSNGKVLITPVGYVTTGATIIFDPASNTLSEGPILPDGDIWADEQSAVLLPDDSFLTFDWYQRGQRFIPSLNQWITDKNLPVQLFSPTTEEVGAGFLLPDGRAFFLGGTGLTVFYAPTGNTNQGTWTQGPNLPPGFVAQDAPAAMMANGKILCALTISSNHSTNYFYEFDPAGGGTFTQTSGPNSPLTDTNYVISDATSMLDLPDGTVLYSDTGGRLYDYQPDTAQIASGKPAINSMTYNPDGTLLVSGTRLNGISQGASFGDDNQMDSNYPLIRFTDGGGNVYYGSTYDWSSTSVMSGGRQATTRCTLPANIFYFQPGVPFSMSVVANGISSDPITFFGPEWVDFVNYIPYVQNGTFFEPFGTLADGMANVPSGGTIVIKAGSSAVYPTISKPMTITAYGGTAFIGR